MIIRQTTTIVFEYPQDYLQEQEWCKTKEDRWIHKSTDTLGAVYENTISYSIGATADRKTEPTISKMEQVDEPQTGVSYSDHTDYDEPKNYVTWTEPQTYITEDRDTQILDAWQVHHRNTTSVKDEPQVCEECEHWNDTEDGCADRHGCTITDCAWK